jgi:hypothetical protein
MTYFFAVFVFCTYVISFLGALFELPLGPIVGDMLSPIRYSLVAWFVMSVFYLIAQAVTKRLNGVVLGSISLATSVFSSFQVMDYLQFIQMPWFVSALKLEPATKMLIAAVFGIALLYVILSPKIWEKFLSHDTRFIIRQFLKTYPTLSQLQQSIIKESIDRLT